MARSRPRGAGSVAVVGRARAESAMGPGVESPAHQFSLDVGIPVVLDLVVRPSGQFCCNQRPLVADKGMKLDDELIFF